MLRKYVLGFLVWLVYRLWTATWRLQVEEPKEMKEFLQSKTPFLMAHWHGDELALIHLARKYKIATITSTSKDGELVNTVLKLLGAKTARGSSTRGAVGALKGLLTLAKQGRNISFAVDGPKGPLHVVKPGIFEFSKLKSFPIFVVAVECQQAILFPRSWNKTYFPKPFAKVKIVWKGPYPAVKKEQDPRSAELAENLKNQLFAAKQDALLLFGEKI